MIISNESMNFKDPKESDDPQVFDDPQLFDDLQLFDDQLEVWTFIIEKSTVIPPSLMVLFCHVQKEPICTYKCRFWIFGRIQNENALLQRLRPLVLHSFGTILLGGLKPRQPVLAEFSRF